MTKKNNDLLKKRWQGKWINTLKKKVEENIKSWKVEGSILKNVISSRILENARRYYEVTKKTCLPNSQTNFSATKKTKS